MGPGAASFPDPQHPALSLPTESGFAHWSSVLNSWLPPTLRCHQAAVSQQAQRVGPRDDRASKGSLMDCLSSNLEASSHPGLPGSSQYHDLLALPFVGGKITTHSNPGLPRKVVPDLAWGNYDSHYLEGGWVEDQEPPGAREKRQKQGWIPGVKIKR